MAVEDTYTVPKRFGMKTMLLVTTVFGILLATAEWTMIPTFVLVFYACFLLSVCVSQMFFQAMPRAISILVGACFMPSVVYASLFFDIDPASIVAQILPRFHVDDPLLWLFVIGGFLGYLSGTVMAGVFLIVDKVVGDKSGRRSVVLAGSGVGKPHWDSAGERRDASAMNDEGSR